MDYKLKWILLIALLASIPFKAIAEPSDSITPIVEVMPIDPLFEKIAWCESKHDLDAQNSYTTAGGEFQFLDGTWKYYGQKYWGEQWVSKDKYSLNNRELAWYVYTTYGTQDWEADPKSHNCWKVEIPNATHRNIY